MSIETWKEEFYSIPASSGMTDKEAVEHGIKKWEGFKAKNRRKHNIIKRERYAIYDSECDEFAFGVDTCSLCHKYYNSGCLACPLHKKGYSCTYLGSPYDAARNGNPAKLIAALKECLITIQE